MSAEQIELLVSHITAGDATDEQWRQFEALADQQPGLWRDLAETQRDHRALTRAMNEMVAVADGVELPLEAAPAPVVVTTGNRWSMRFVNWSGWAVAAVVALAAGLRLAWPGAEPAAPPVSPPQPVAVAPATIDDALQAYLDLGKESGTVVGEMPTKVLLDTRPSETGEGYDLLYLRQFIERRHVPDLYRWEGRDDQGRPTLARWEQPAKDGGSM